MADSAARHQQRAAPGQRATHLPNVVSIGSGTIHVVTPDTETTALVAVGGLLK